MNQKKAVFVLGIRWRDTKYGNSYFRPVIFCDDGDRISGEYQYGTAYLHEAERICSEKGIAFENPAYTDKWVTKAEAKDERYY